MHAINMLFVLLYTRIPNFQIDTFMQTSPQITPHTRSFVHHMLIYICSYALDPSLVGVGGPCNEVHENITECLRGGYLIGAWAVGGEVSIIIKIEIKQQWNLAIYSVTKPK